MVPFYIEKRRDRAIDDQYVAFLFEKIKIIAKSCMVFAQKDGSISIYSYGFQGTFSDFTWFFNGKNETPCSHCKHRIRNTLMECDVKESCFGFEESKPYEWFDAKALFAFLEGEGYVIIRNHTHGFVLYPKEKKPIIYVSLFEPDL